MKISTDKLDAKVEGTDAVHRVHRWRNNKCDVASDYIDMRRPGFIPSRLISIHIDYRRLPRAAGHGSAEKRDGCSIFYSRFSMTRQLANWPTGSRRKLEVTGEVEVASGEKRPRRRTKRNGGRKGRESLRGRLKLLPSSGFLNNRRCKQLPI